MGPLPQQTIIFPMSSRWAKVGSSPESCLIFGLCVFHLDLGKNVMGEHVEYYNYEIPRFQILEAKLW
jgi:hypothetical protein